MEFSPGEGIRETIVWSSVPARELGKPPHAVNPGRGIKETIA